MKALFDVAEALLELALALIDLAADLGRPVAAELADLFLDLAFSLVPLAFDLVVHSVSSLDATVRGPTRIGANAMPPSSSQPCGVGGVTGPYRGDLTPATPPLSSRG